MKASDIYRSGRLSEGLSERMVDYISSLEDDKEIAGHIIDVNIAHTLALLRAGVISKNAASKIVKALYEVKPAGLKPTYKMEDAHMLIEALVLEKAGREGENLNLGKSRNEQVAAAIRMRLRERIINVIEAAISLAASLLEKASEYGDAVMPGYTHLQPAQPVTLGYLLAAHVEALIRDMHRLVEAYNRVNLSPLGAAAMSGSTVRVSRYYLARLLGFKDIIDNTVDAVASRDFLLEVLAGFSSLAVEVSRLAEHIVLWSNPSFGFIVLPDALSATSSIMPNKKNPVIAELARAKTAAPASSFMAVLMILKAQEYSYNLDLQEATPYAWRAASSLESTLRIMSDLVRGIKANKPVMLRAAASGFVTASDLAEYLTVKYGVPFRTAHRIVGKLVKAVVENKLEWGGKLRDRLVRIASEEGYSIDVNAEELEKILSVHEAIARRKHVKMSGEEFRLHLEELSAKLRRIAAWRKAVVEELKKSRRLLEERAKALMGGE